MEPAEQSDVLTARDNFAPRVKDLLAKRVGHRCSNPGCTQPTSGPQLDPEKSINIGVASHITAAAAGGPRYDSSLSAEARTSSDNGIWLCQTCGKLVDNDPGRYTVATLRDWKHSSERYAAWQLENRSSPIIDPAYARVGSAAVSQPEMAAEALVKLASDAAASLITSWARRTAGKPLIDLRLVRLDDNGVETQEMQQGSDLNVLLLSGQKIVIEAPAGRGKTTTLVQLAETHRAAGRIACLIDLPKWVRRKVGIFDFLANTEEFQFHGFTASSLAKINQAQPFTFLLNGWNELALSESAEAATLISDLEGSFGSAGMAIATRAHPVTPPLRNCSRFRIQPLTKQERNTYLQQRLRERANDLIAVLGGDPALDELTTTPMILAEVASLFEAGKSIPSSKLGVLDAVTRLMENSENHQAALANPPLSRLARRYLEELGSWLVTSGGVQIDDAQARSLISSIGRALQDSGQTAAVPDPGAILTALCSHHVLEQSTYPEVSYTFIHQQFQELFAALRLKRELDELVATGAGRSEFAAKYVNEPAWSQPLYMLAGFIGQHGPNEPLPNDVAMGKELIEMALPIDAVFAADLARLCGANVWTAVRESLGARLRQLYGSQDTICRNTGIAGMIASGSDDFKDIIVPLVSSEDRTLRFNTYRAWGPFYTDSLGKDWRQTVEQWNETSRVHFVAETLRHSPSKAKVISFALADPSTEVRMGLLSNIWWAMSRDEIVRFSQTLDDDQFFGLIRAVPARYLPAPLRPRAAKAYANAAGKSGDPVRRLFAWSEAALMGDVDAVVRLKGALSEIPTEQISKIDQTRLRSVVDLIVKSDSGWVTQWVIRNLLSGGLHPEYWMTMASGISDTLRDELLDRVTSEDLAEKRVPGVIPLLRTFADSEIVTRLFRKLCELRPIIATSRPGDDKQAEAKLARQLEDLLREMPPNVVVESILHELNGRTGAVEIDVIVEIFHIAGRSDSSLREGLTTELREALRNHLKLTMPVVLAQEDFSGQLKGHLATVIAQIGEPLDLIEIERLIQSDIERVRTGRLARAADHRSKQGNDSVMSWTVWYVQAMLQLDSGDGVRDLLVRLLEVPGYELDAAWGLFQLARKDHSQPLVWARNWPMRTKDFSVIWKSRAGETESIFVEPKRAELAAIVRYHIESLVTQRSADPKPAGFDGRLKHLAIVLAELDARASADLVLEILSYPEIGPTRPRTHRAASQPVWLHDAWPRIHGLEALLINGVAPPAAKTWEILGPVIQHVRDHRWDSNQLGMLTHAFCIMIFTDDPATEIARVRELLKQDRLSFEGTERFIRALGQSRSNAAIELLREFGEIKHQSSHLGDTWIDAVAQFDTEEARNLLLGFIDPLIGGIPNDALAHHDDRLVTRLTELARRNAGVGRRIFELVYLDLSTAQISLLGKILASLGTTEALLCALELLNDEGSPAMSYELQKRIEESFVEHRPEPGTTNTFTLVPRSSNAIRAKLLDMSQNDPKRKKSAYALLSQIESWRMEHGRPDGEPRSPRISEGSFWPPDEPL